MTKLSDLAPTQRAAFFQVIRDGVTNDKSAKQVQDDLAKWVGKAFGERMVQRYMEKCRNREANPVVLPAPPQAPSMKLKEDGETLTMSGTGSETAEVSGLIRGRVVTLEDALKKANVDLTKWDVGTWEITAWEMGYVDKNKDPGVLPLWRVNVKLKAKKGWNPTEFRAILKEDLKALAPSYRVPSFDHNPAVPILAELSIFDAHFGKLAWSPETGQDYDIKICRTRYMNAARDLLARAAIYNPERIVYVVGNDFFHCDHRGLTFNGTQMDCDGRWQKAFRIGKDCTITIAEEASQIAPVDLIIVSGNHDREKAFCLGEVLDARFTHNHNINVVNDPDLYSYYRWGKVLLGFVHGDNHTSDKKRAELPQTMATDRPVDWSETVWREWHLGHFHSEAEDVWHYRKAKQIRDLTVRVLPSLSSTDAWHREQGYASPIAAECHLYHKDKGRWGYLVHHAEP